MSPVQEAIEAIDNEVRILDIRRFKLQIQLAELCPLDASRPDLYKKCCSPSCPSRDSCNTIMIQLKALKPTF